MQVIFSPRALRDLKKLNKNLQERILEKLTFYNLQGKPTEFADKLIESKYGHWRFRIGDYGVLLDLEDDNIIILRIGHRKDIYK
jgi:mRNA interferase RelE/StbE